MTKGFKTKVRKFRRETPTFGEVTLMEDTNVDNIASLDVGSLFANIPLNENIYICLKNFFPILKPQ